MSGWVYLELASIVKLVLSRLVQMNSHAWKLCQNCLRYSNVYIRSLRNARDFDACIIYELPRPSSSRYAGFMPAFTNPVYLTVIVCTHHAHGLCVITWLAPYNTAPHNSYQPHPAEPPQHTTCSNTRLVLLKMGIKMPETC